MWIIGLKITHFWPMFINIPPGETIEICPISDQYSHFIPPENTRKFGSGMLVKSEYTSK